MGLDIRVLSQTNQEWTWECPLHSLKLFLFCIRISWSLFFFFFLFRQDYFTNANKELEKDTQQDYHLDYAMENSTHTIIEFTRELHTCDANDKRITVSRVRLSTLMGNMVACLHVWSNWVTERKRPWKQYWQRGTILGKFLICSLQTLPSLKPYISWKAFSCKWNILKFSFRIADFKK